MKHARILFVIVSVAVLFMAIAPQINAQPCSRGTVAGDWAATLTGTIILPSGEVPAAAVVRISADLSGNFSGTEARNVGGEFVRETLTGNWTVNPDCTGRATASIFQSGVLARTVVLAMVFDSLSTELRMVQPAAKSQISSPNLSRSSGIRVNHCTMGAMSAMTSWMVFDTGERSVFTLVLLSLALEIPAR